MNKLILFFKSKAFKEGYTSVKNPYADAATDHNLKNGLGASPWWDTNYKPFIDWEQGSSAKSYEKFLKT
jgi:hypothetical protein